MRQTNLAYLCIHLFLKQASSDQSELDWEVYHKFNGFMVTTVSLIGTIIVMSQVGWEILLLFAPVFVACISMQVGSILFF